MLNIEKKLKDNLNKEQYKAATFSGNDSLILAGAGSGKTQTLTYKISYLLGKKKIKKENLLVMTFTNKASKELKDRIEKIVGIYPQYIGTFHSVFLKILREILSKKQEFGLKTNYNEKFTISENQDIVLKGILNNLYGNDFSSNHIKNLISQLKNEGISPENCMDFFDNMEIYVPNEFKVIYKEYQNILEEYNIMDFDNLLYFLNLFLSNKKIKKYLEYKFKYILIDEAQDTNEIQFKILNLFKGEKTYIGDDFQSLYSFRGAKMNKFLELGDNMKIFKLTTNYRSLPHIVNAGNSIISHNSKQYSKNLYPFREGNGKVNILKYDTDLDEAQEIISKIIKIKKNKKIDWNKFAIMARINSQLDLYENILKKENIPFNILKGNKKINTFEFKYLMSFFQYLGNKKDITSLQRIISYSLGESNKINKINQSLLNGKNLDYLIQNKTLKKEKYKLEEIKKLFLKIEKINSKKTDLLKSFNVLIKNIYGSEKYTNEIIKLLNYIINEYIKSEEEQSLSIIGFVNFFSLYGMDLEKQDKINGIKVMTIHGSKGLEFPYVFMVGLQEGIFPISKATHTKEGLEEERRIFYVGVTRSRDKIWLSYSQQTSKNGKLRIAYKSRFLDEIDNKLVKFKDKTFKSSIIEF